MHKTLAAIVAAAALAIAVATANAGTAIPRCAEDAVLVGAPDATFVDGHWSALACGPSADDYQPAP